MNDMDSGKNVSKRFEFKNVVTISFFWFIFMGLLPGLGCAHLYSEFAFRYFGVQGLYFVAFAGILSIAAALYFLNRNKYNEEKRNTLRSFIRTMQTEMNFEKRERSRLRAFKQM
ncbi:MAG: hypothetical protein LBP30_08615, partial [Clostridiales Family XIII bacterium]|nr:hypothetical protein [Clostridiales Family XIII bacterium]